MPTKLFSDSARHTTLASGISGGAATITVADASGWPSPAAGQEANVAVDYGDQSLVEVGTYSSRSGNTLSGVTGIANAHSAGAKVWHVLSAADAAKGANASSSIFVRKTADELVTNSTAFQNDDHLTFAIAANEIWVPEFFVLYTADAAGDIRFYLSVPAGANWRMLALAPDASDGMAASVFEDMNSTSTFTRGGSTTRRISLLKALVRNGSTAGNVTLQWAQGASHATSTTVRTDSYLLAHKVS